MVQRQSKRSEGGRWVEKHVGGYVIKVWRSMILGWKIRGREWERGSPHYHLLLAMVAIGLERWRHGEEAGVWGADSYLARFVQFEIAVEGM